MLSPKRKKKKFRKKTTLVEKVEKMAKEKSRKETLL